MRRYNFQIDHDDDWFQVMTDLTTWYVVSPQGNERYASLLDLPEAWQDLMVGLASNAIKTPTQLIENPDELVAVLLLLHGTRARFPVLGCPTVDGMGVYSA